jgi:hypothetical protein
MQFTKVSYSGCFNLGDYQNEKIHLEVQINEDENPETIIEELRGRVRKMATPNVQDLFEQGRTVERRINELRRKCQQWENRWQSTVDFLKTQGINPNAPDMPAFDNLLPEADSEDVCIGEIDNPPF